jgi:hypothetical protein
MEVGRLRKIGKTILVFLGCCAVGESLAQKPAVSLTVSKKEVASKHTVSFTVTTNVEGNVKIDFPVSFEADYSVMHGVDQRMDPSGKVSTYSYTQQSGQFTKEGSFTFCAYLTYRNKTYKSNKITVKVDDNFAEDDLKVKSTDPVFGIIQASKTSVYEGEPVLLKARIFSYININFLESYDPFMADKSMEEHVFQNGRQEVEQTKVNGKDALTFDYGKKLFIPVATGKVKIKPYEMVLECQGRLFSKTVRFTSSSFTVNVKPLPSGAPKDFIDAVGTYSMSQKEVALSSLKQGEVFSIEVTVSGIGNIHNTTAPSLNLPAGCVIYGDPERKEDVNFSEEGAVGTVTYVYNVQVTKAGQIDFAEPSFSYFDPIKEKYITVKGQRYSLTVKADKAFQAVQVKQIPNGGGSKTGGSTDVVAIKKQSEKAGTNWFLVTGIVGGTVCLAFLFLFFVKRKKEETDTAVREKKVEEKPVRIEDLVKETQNISVRSLSELELLIDKPNEFAVQFPQVLIAILAEKLTVTEISREKVFAELAVKNPSIANELRTYIDNCDNYRYGFGSVELKCEEILNSSKNLIGLV